MLAFGVQAEYDDVMIRRGLCLAFDHEHVM